MHKINQQGYMAVHCQGFSSVLSFLDVVLEELRLLWWQSGCRQPVQAREKMNQSVTSHITRWDFMLALTFMQYYKTTQCFPKYYDL